MTASKKYVAERKARMRTEIFNLIVAAKEVPCERCHGFYPSVCMDFDHLPEHEKEFNIGSPSNWTSVDRIRSEIAKCQVVCSNCHRILTWERKNGRQVQAPDTRKAFWRNLLTQANNWGRV